MTSVRQFGLATLEMYRDSAVQASRDLARNWPILVGSIALYIVYSLSLRILQDLGGGLGFAAGMIAGMIQIALLTLYYSWISQSIDRERLRLEALVQFDYGLFFNIISVAFVLFIAQFLLGQLTAGLDASSFLLCVQLGIVLVFNAIPEVIHLNRIESTFALAEAAKFTRDNWIEWYLPLLLVISPWLFYNAYSVLLVLAQSDPLLPPFVIVQGASIVALYSNSLTQWALPVIALVVANWFMLFRAHLFKSLQSGSRRQRIFRSRGS